MSYYRNYWNDIKIIRRIKGGDWVKTLDHGWITHELYEHYKSMGYDPGVIELHFRIRIERKKEEK